MVFKETPSKEKSGQCTNNRVCVCVWNDDGHVRPDTESRTYAVNRGDGIYLRTDS